MNIHPSPEIPFELFQRLEPTYEPLLDVLITHLTPEILGQIAGADYGMGANECLQDLEQIVNTRQLPTKASFILTECLELTRWIMPTTERQHIARVFSATLLLILEKLSNYASIGDENETLVVMIDSLVALQIDAKPALQLLAWRISTDYQEEKEAYLAAGTGRAYLVEIAANDFFMYGLLLLLVYGQAPVQDIDRMIQWLIETEKDTQNLPPFYSEYRAQHMSHKHRPLPFLLAQTNFDQRHEVWKSLSAQMQTWLEQVPAVNTQQQLKHMSDCVVNEQPMIF